MLVELMSVLESEHNNFMRLACLGFYKMDFQMIQKSKNFHNHFNRLFHRVIWVIITVVLLVYFGYAAVDILYDFTQKELITKVIMERATTLKVDSALACCRSSL